MTRLGSLTASVFLLGALASFVTTSGAACTQSSGGEATPDAGEDVTPPEAGADADAASDADTGTSGVLVPTGRFAIVYDEGTSHFGVYPVSKDEKGNLVPVKDKPPISGGFEASAPADIMTTGCPGAGSICGVVALKNLETKLRRNVFAVVSEITPGWSLDGDDKRGLTLPDAVAYVDYEHVSIGTKTADRTWSFRGGTGSFRAIVELYSSDVECTASGAEDPHGAPDVDADCDGVPGASRTASIFVDPTFGDDGGDGSIRAPFKTVLRATASVDDTRATLVLAAGTHDGALAPLPNHRLDLSKVRAVLGGYDGARGFAERSTAETIVVHPPDPATHDAFGFVRGDGAVDLFLQRLTVRAVGGAATELAPAGSAYALDLRKGGGTLTLDKVSIVAIGGKGLAGKAGATGLAGVDGGAGGTIGAGKGGAGTACLYGGNSGSGGDGGAGGVLGGDEVTGAGSDGKGGSDATPATPKPLAPGGTGASSSDICEAPFGTRDGQSAPAVAWDGKGKNGLNGTPPSAKPDLQIGWFSSDRYVIDAGQSGSAAAHGTPGAGGAGGGGGGACTTERGGNAGGGGAGGCGGQGGLGGTAGGGAFAIWTLGTTSVVFGDGVSLTVVGGEGGAGGEPGASGLGGAGGIGESSVGRVGGDGSHGAMGGAGGVGGGANGGPAACVARKTAVTFPTTGYTCSTTGGAGGSASLSELGGAVGGAIDTLVY